MKLELYRERRDGCTPGRLFVDGVYFCDTLEDDDKLSRGLEKVPGETAIPSGTYRILMTVSPRFKELLPLLDGVPGFAGIRIHAGNSTQDTSGCILVGKKASDGIKLTSSRKTLDILVKRMKNALLERQPLIITIK